MSATPAIRSGSEWIPKGNTYPEGVVKARLRRRPEAEEERVCFHPAGGGGVFTATIDKFLDVFREVTGSERAGVRFDRGLFGFDDGPVVLGWHVKGDHWNGWAKPLVEPELLQRFVAESQVEGELPLFEFRGEEDRLECRFIGQGPESSGDWIGLETIQTPEGPKAVFDVAEGLCWFLSEEDEIRRLISLGSGMILPEGYDPAALLPPPPEEEDGIDADWLVQAALEADSGDGEIAQLGDLVRRMWDKLGSGARRDLLREMEEDGTIPRLREQLGED